MILKQMCVIIYPVVNSNKIVNSNLKFKKYIKSHYYLHVTIKLNKYTRYIIISLLE